MAEPGTLAGMYGVETPDDVAAKRRAMSHTPEGVGPRPEPVTNFGRQAAGLTFQGPDPDLDALARQAGDAPMLAQDVGQGAREATGALGGAMEGNLADVEYWQRQRQGLGPVVSRSRNAAFPFVQRQGAEALAREGEAPAEFESQPFDPPEQEVGEDDRLYAERLQLASMDHQLRQQDAEEAFAMEQQPQARDIGQGGEIGMLEAERRTQEGLTEAQVQQNTVMATAEANAAMAKQDQIETSRMALQEERDFQMAQRDRLLQAQDVEQSTRQKLESMPALDGQRYTDNLGIGQKILFGIAALASGWTGSTSAVDLVRGLNQEKLEEQRLNHEMGIKAYDAAKGAVDQGMNLYGMIKNEMGDPVASEMMFMNLLEEDEMAKLREEAAKTTEPIRRQQILQHALEIEQSIRDRRDQMGLRLAQAHEYTTRVSDPHRREREFAEEQLGESLTAQRDLRGRGVDIGMAREKQEGALQLQDVKTQGAAATKQAEVKGRRDMDIKKASDEWGAVETHVRDFMEVNPDNIHGVGAPLTGSQNDRIRTRQFMSALELLATSGFTGATATERQAEQIKEMIEGGTFEVDDEAFRTRMESILNIASSRRRYYQNQLGGAEARIGETSEMKSFQPL